METSEESSLPESQRLGQDDDYAQQLIQNINSSLSMTEQNTSMMMESQDGGLVTAASSKMEGLGDEKGADEGAN